MSLLYVAIVDIMIIIIAIIVITSSCRTWVTLFT